MQNLIFNYYDAFAGSMQYTDPVTNRVQSAIKMCEDQNESIANVYKREPELRY